MKGAEGVGKSLGGSQNGEVIIAGDTLNYPKPKTSTSQMTFTHIIQS